MTSRPLRIVGLLLVVLVLPVGRAQEQRKEEKPVPELTAAEKELAAKADKLSEEGQQFCAQNKFEDAHRREEEAYAIRQNLYPASCFPDGHPDLAKSLSNLGSVLDDLGQLSQALSYYEQALAMYRKLYPASRFPDGHPDLARCLNNLGYVLLADSQPSKALPYYEQAMAMRQKLYPVSRYPDGHSDLANSLNSLASVLDDLDQPSQALPYYEQALAMYRKLYPASRFPDGHPNLAKSLSNLGYQLHGLGQPSKALPYYEQALAMYQKLYPVSRLPDGQADLANSLNILASVLDDLGQLSKSLLYHEQALAMRQKLYPASRFPDGHADLARSLNNLGFVLLALGQPNKALTYYEQALAMYQKLYPVSRLPDGHPDLARSLNNLGSVLDDLGQPSQALPYYEQALAMRQKLYPASRFPDGHADLARSLNNLGFVLLALGQPNKALTYHEQALAMYQKLYPASRFPDGHADLARSLNNLGFVLFALYRPNSALPYYEQALTMFRKYATQQSQFLSEVEALALVESLPRTQHSFLSLTAHEGNGSASYETIWGGRALVSRVFEQRALAVRAAQATPAVRALWTELADSRRQVAVLLQASQRSPEAEDQLLRLTAQKERLERQLAQSLPVLVEETKLDVLTANDLRRALPRGTAFLDCLHHVRLELDPSKPDTAGERRTPSYLVFVLRQERPIQRVDLGPAAPIDQAVAAWRAALASGHDDVAALKLRDLVWQPLAKHLDGIDTVYLTPEGALTRLPWAALLGSKPDTILLEELTIALVPHGRFLLGQLRKPAPKPDTTILAVGGVAYDDQPSVAVAANRGVRLVDERLLFVRPARQWPFLVGTQHELDAVTRLAVSHSVTRLGGPDASTRRIEQELPKAAIAHLATHGFFDQVYLKEEREREARLLKSWTFAGQGTQLGGHGARSPLAYCGLVFAGANRPETNEDFGILTGEAILNVNLDRMHLAVLSACETGLGDQTTGECVANLQRAFHIAGCRNVIGSLWKVPDEATAALMNVFYEELLRKKQSPLQALRTAQLTIYRYPERIPALARGDRGAPVAETRPNSSALATSPTARAPVRQWAAFVLSGLGQ